MITISLKIKKDNNNNTWLDNLNKLRQEAAIVIVSNQFHTLCYFDIR